MTIVRRHRGARHLALVSLAVLGVAGAACGTTPRNPNEPKREPARGASTNGCSDDRLAHGGQFLPMPDGVSVWYKLSGREGAPVIAYLHGGPGYNAYAFEQSAGKLLEATFRVLYIDQRGSGRSGFDGPDDAYGMEKTVSDVDRIREAIGAERIGLLGHSFGGAVAATYAHRFPKRTFGVVMVDTTPFLGRALAHEVDFIDSQADTAFLPKAGEIHAVARSEGSAFGKLQKLYGIVGRVPLQARMHYASDVTQTAMEAMDAASGIMGCTSGRTVAAFEREGFLAEGPADLAAPLNVPSLLIAGRSSEVIGKENIEAAARAWGAETTWVDGAGHFVYFEKPRELTDLVVRFFTRNAG